MSFRQVIIKKAKKICLKNRALLIEKEDKELKIPLEDISIVLLEDPFTVITTRILTEFSKHHISLILCDETFFPNTQTIPINTHYNLSSILKKQINLDIDFRGSLWKIIIKKKIINQARIIELTSQDMNAKNILYGYIQNIKENDDDNREGIASKVFFSSLYGTDFIRFSDKGVSKALDYGYTLLTNTMVRTLVSFGFNPSIGIWHDNNKNPINLACDLIEPFRPIIDYFVYWNKDNIISKELTFEIRKKLINLLNFKVEIKNKKYSLEYAMQIIVKEFLNVIETGDITNFEFPTIIESDMYNYAIV